MGIRSVEADAVDDALITLSRNTKFGIICLALVSLSTAGLAHAQGSLIILDPTISGDTVTLPIHLEGNVLDGVAALDFQLSFDVTILQPVQTQPGEAATNAGKEVQARLLADGQYEVLMFGLERNAFAQGEVARITLNKLSDPKGGETPVTISNTKLATVSGSEIPSQGSTITLLFESDSETGGAGGLPPTGGGGDSSQTATTRNTEPTSASSNATDTATSRGELPTGGPGAFDLPKAQAAADARLSMLREARAEREAARASVEGQSPDPVNTSELRVRRNPRSAGPILASGSESDRKRAAREISEGDIGVPRPALDPVETAQQPPGLSQDSDGNDDLSLPEPIIGPTDNSLMIDDRPRSDSSYSKGLRVQAAVLAGFIAVALGIYAVRRRP